MLAGIPGDYLGQGYPLFPGLTVSVASLALDAALATLAVLPLAALSLWRGWRLRALPVLAGLWLWGGAMVIYPFVIDFGTTWQGTEALRALFLHPVRTPLALAALMAAGYGLLAPRGRAR